MGQGGSNTAFLSVLVWTRLNTTHPGRGAGDQAWAAHSFLPTGHRPGAQGPSALAALACGLQGVLRALVSTAETPAPLRTFILGLMAGLPFTVESLFLKEQEVSDTQRSVVALADQRSGGRNVTQWAHGRQPAVGQRATPHPGRAPRGPTDLCPARGWGAVSAPVKTKPVSRRSKHGRTEGTHSGPRGSHAAAGR